jgi:hypothetical protein
MDWLNPLTYQMANPSQLPYVQPSEIQAVANAEATHTPAEDAAAQKLSDTGMDTMWMDYANQYQSLVGPARAAPGIALLQAVMAEDGVAFTQAKELAGEPRPFELGIKAHGDSFPSGHSSTAYAAATVMAYLWPQRAAEFLNAAANVARSRVYLGLHFPGDTAAGAHQGVAIAEQAIAAFGANGSVAA